MPSGFELIIVLVVVVLLFGASRLPKLARSMGQASKEFKRGVSEGADGDTSETTKPDDPKPDDPKPDDRVTMTQAELDALLAEREAQARRDTPQP